MGSASSAAQEALEKELSGLRKLWLVLALISLAVSVNILVATQGGAVRLGVKSAIPVDFDRDIPEAIAGLWGIVYLSVFIGLGAAVLVAHARRMSGGWAHRYPFRAFDVPPGRGVGLAAQVISLLILTLLPVYVLGHSWKTLLNHGVLCVEVSPADWRPRAGGDRVFFTTPAGAQPGPTRLTSDEVTAPETGMESPANPKRCKKFKVTDYWAPVESWLLAGLSGTSVATLCLSLLTVFRRGGSPSNQYRRGRSGLIGT